MGDTQVTLHSLHISRGLLAAVQTRPQSILLFVLMKSCIQPNGRKVTIKTRLGRTAFVVQGLKIRFVGTENTPKKVGSVNVVKD